MNAHDEIRKAQGMSVEMAVAILCSRALEAAIKSAETQTPIAPGHAGTMEILEAVLPFDSPLFVPQGIDGIVERARHAIRHPDSGQFVPAVAPGIPSPGIWRHLGASLLRRN